MTPARARTDDPDPERATGDTATGAEAHDPHDPHDPPPDATTDGRARRWAGHREARRLELVDAAVSAIADHGPEVTTEQIAERAGVSRPGLYRHFAGKDDLQGAIAARSVERLVEGLGPVWRPTGEPAEMLRAALGTHLRWMAANGNVYRYLRRTPLDASGGSAATNVRTTVGRHVAGMFVDGTLGVEVTPAVAHPLAFSLVGMVDSAAGHWLDEPHGMSVDELAAQLTDACWAVITSTLGLPSVPV